MIINYNFCCKKLRDCALILLDEINGSFHLRKLESFKNLCPEENYIIKYCPFCGEKINIKINVKGGEKIV